MGPVCLCTSHMRILDTLSCPAKLVQKVHEGALVRSSVSDVVPLVPRGWDIGPTIPMGPSPWPSWNARTMGISTKGDLCTYKHIYMQDRRFEEGGIQSCRGRYFAERHIHPRCYQYPYCIESCPALILAKHLSSRSGVQTKSYRPLQSFFCWPKN